jgi:septum formation protein
MRSRVDMKIILASGSPRRHELLAAAGVEFEVIPSPAEELHDASLGMARLCEENARLKAMAVAIDHQDCLVIGADTLVFLDGEPLGKPADIEEARLMLRRLAGREHQVCTGVCLVGPGEQVKGFHQITRVGFRNLDDAAISEYLSKTQPLDKAGAYGIQDHGEMIIQNIHGAFDNVMGLPVEKVIGEIAEMVERIRHQVSPLARHD